MDNDDTVNQKETVHLTHCYVYVTALGATGLRRGNSDTAVLDPFLRIDLVDENQKSQTHSKTTTCRNTASPRWNKEFLFFTLSPKGQHLLFTVHDETLEEGHTEIGRSSIPLDHLKPNQDTKETFSVGGESGGVVRVNLKLVVPPKHATKPTGALVRNLPALRVILPKSSYEEGEMVEGFVKLCTGEPVDLRGGLQLTLRGWEQARHTQGVTGTTQYQAQVVYKGHHEHFKRVQSLSSQKSSPSLRRVDSGLHTPATTTKATSLIFRVLKQVDSSTEDFVLKPGIYEWEFKFKLPMEGLPPSFRSNSEGWKGGHICYSVDGTIKQRDSDGTKKSVTRTYFNLIHKTPKPTKNVPSSCSKSFGGMKVSVSVNRTLFVSKSPTSFWIKLDVTNPSRKEIAEIYLSVNSLLRLRPSEPKPTDITKVHTTYFSKALDHVALSKEKEFSDELKVDLPEGFSFPSCKGVVCELEHVVSCNVLLEDGEDYHEILVPVQVFNAWQE